MEELFLIGNESDRKRMYFVHKGRGVLSVWLLGKSYECLVRSDKLRIDRIQPDLVEGEDERKRRSRPPKVQVINDGKLIVEISDARFFTQDNEIFSGNQREQMFVIARNERGDMNIIFITYNDRGTVCWRMTNNGFEKMAEGNDIRISRIQAVSISEMEMMDEEKRRRARALPPNVRIEKAGAIILELSLAKFFKEVAPMRVDLR